MLGRIQRHAVAERRTQSVRLGRKHPRIGTPKSPNQQILHPGAASGGENGRTPPLIYRRSGAHGERLRIRRGEPFLRQFVSARGGGTSGAERERQTDRTTHPASQYLVLQLPSPTTRPLFGLHIESLFEKPKENIFLFLHFTLLLNSVECPKLFISLCERDLERETSPPSPTKI